MTIVTKQFARLLLAAGICLPMLFINSHSKAADETTGKVVRVTLYRQQALVSRRVSVAGGKGSLQIVVSDLPDQIVAGSLFAEGPETVEVRAVRLRTRAVGQEPREEVRKLDAAIQDTTDQISANASAGALLVQRTEYLDKLAGFVAPTAKTELSKGVLDAEALQQVTMFVFEQRQEIAGEKLQLDKESRQLQEELSLLERKRSEITAGASRDVREAVLFLEKHNDQPESVQLHYLVDGCGWSPSYTFRAREDLKEVRVEYNAMIHQLTGEDWSDVKLTLSTASPALAAAGPGLAPFHIGLKQLAAQSGKSQIPQFELAERLRGYQQQQSLANVVNRNTFSLRDNIDSAWGVNFAACNINLLELTGGQEIVGTLELQIVGAGAEPSLSYELDSSVSLPSRSDQQMVRILQTGFKSKFYHVATPVLTQYVYREAELTNASGQDLLAGPITVYLEGRFVGRGEIPTVARGQEFVVGFGANPQLRVRRELASKEDSVQGGNRELSINYRLVIENYKQDAVPLRVYDRLPYSNRSADVRITLNGSADKLSIDKLYLRRERPKGILRWDVDVPAGATGEDARIVQYGYTVEHDRKFELTALSGEVRRLQQEFEELQRGRFIR